MFQFMLFAMISCGMVLCLNVNADIKTDAPYGKWESPITPEKMTAKVRNVGDVQVDHGQIYWTEFRPEEKGKTRLVKLNDEGSTTVLTAEEVSVRTRIHEYGGNAYVVDGTTIYYVNFADQRLYRMVNGQAEPITEEGLRFSDFKVTPHGLVVVVEDHHQPEDVKNYLGIIKDKKLEVLDAGHDFYSSPVISPDGKKIAWLTWDHPNMPWDGTDLWLAEFNEGKILHKKHLTGGKSESIFQPAWSPHNELYFVSDKTGWWNIYRMVNNTIEAVHPMQAEFGLPQWVFGMKTYAFTGRGDEIIATYQQQGLTKMALIDPHTKSFNNIDLGAADYSSPVSAGNGNVIVSVGYYDQPRKLMQVNLENLEWKQLDQPKENAIDKDYFAEPEFVEYPSVNGRKAYGFFYPPKNKQFKGSSQEKPPLIVFSHGGPTASTSATFSLAMQFWTSRGFAILDVNYGGSTGFGRHYRDLLKGNWGIVDVEDCEKGALYLVEKGLVDPKRIFIRGGSAGGYTTLAALTFTKTFAGGASYYGVADLELLVKETHKFEARYTDQLVGDYPQEMALYEARSPLKHVDRICCPIIFFQGAEDKVVPLSQAQVMYEALKKAGITTELIVYPTEGHGFRQAENIQHSLINELRFYQNLL